MTGLKLHMDIATQAFPNSNESLVGIRNSGDTLLISGSGEGLWIYYLIFSIDYFSIFSASSAFIRVYPSTLLSACPERS